MQLLLLLLQAIGHALGLVTQLLLQGLLGILGILGILGAAAQKTRALWLSVSISQLIAGSQDLSW